MPLPLPFIARIQAIRLQRPGARAVLPLEAGALRDLLARREQLLVAEERAAVAAALAEAPPELRAELERRLGRERDAGAQGCTFSTLP